MPVADISPFIQIIQLASRGEEVRDAIINALEGINAQTAHPEPDAALSDSSENAVQNKAITEALRGKQDVLSFDAAPVAGSANPITSGGVAQALESYRPSAAPDWLQNDATQPDYIKNRPFYSIENWSLTATGSGAVLNAIVYINVSGVRHYYCSAVTLNSPLTSGKSYRVTVNGETRTLTAAVRTYTRTTSGSTANLTGTALVGPGYVFLCTQASGGYSLSLYVADADISYTFKVEKLDSETVTRLPGKFVDFSSRAPEFLDSALVSLTGVFEDSSLLTAYGGAYRRAYVSELADFVLSGFETDALDTDSRTVTEAINELAAQLDELPQLRSQLAALSERQERLEAQNAALRAQLAALRALIDPDGVQAAVETDGTLALSGSGVSVANNILNLDSVKASVESGSLTL